MTAAAMPSTTDRIERELRLESPRARVWRALTDHEEFGKWFGIKFESAFTPGTTLVGHMTGGKYANVPYEFHIDRIEPQHLFSFRWRPFALDPNVDYSGEPHTLIVFTLDEVDAGTPNAASLLRVVESGFDAIPAARRTVAFEMNGKGWTAQLANIKRYVEQPVNA
jgi:uncharacterized protein YndB with AHSA1/START domain